MDYISDSSNNEIQNPLLYSQQSLLSLSSYHLSPSQSVEISSARTSPPTPSFSPQDLYHEYNTYHFLKIYKKLIPKFLKYHQLHLSGRNRQQEKVQRSHRYLINDQVKINLRQFQDSPGIILKIRKS